MASQQGKGADPMNWHPPVPRRVTDAAGGVWSVQRAWPEMAAGRYVLEVRKPGWPGVLAGRFAEGRFDPVTVTDRRLPALAAESAKGEVVVHRAHRRAVLRTPAGYVKVLPPGWAPTAAASHTIAAAPLAAAGFNTPRLITAGRDVLVFSAVPGRSFYELGQDRTGITDAFYAAKWAEWQRAWTETVASASSPAFRTDLERLPLHDAEEEAVSMRRWIDHWLHHSEGIAEAAKARAALMVQADAVTAGLLAQPRDPLGWAHGDLHEKQMLGTDHPGAPGLLDFDESCRAEAALDLANLDVHVELRWRQHLLSTGRYIIAHASIMSAAERLDVSPGRLDAYCASARLRLACLYSFRPIWGPRPASYPTSLVAAHPEQTRFGT
ncbi:hypothetical protein LFT45_20085 [Arthrobacter sp. FW305-BF8]|uniref:phosphotransferase n=1 Tax=Arthrobacter sp. FW305-BF8 TaxID=2879617 RepID=UPI001F381320|nr:phosphotransferase [Arthrobacter sp. FW305-BF8]UKA53975.1 hypothetical protein LFT45_20085 [Arthrobacter sp. FW305-BF8]